MGSALRNRSRFWMRSRRAFGPLGTTELAEELGLSRQSVHRVVLQLESQQMIQREPAGDRLLLEARLRQLGLAAISTAHRIRRTHHVLAELVEHLHETCNVGMLDGAEVVYIDRVECDWPLRAQFKLGSRVPVHCTAIGKLMLAHMESSARHRLLRRLPLTRYTPHTITRTADLEEALETIRVRGYSTNNEEDSVGLVALAVPVRDPCDEVVAGLAVHAPTPRMNLDAMQAKRRRLANAAQLIARELFFDEPVGMKGSAAG